ncbi:MAG: LuxR C-terminal-related transcriptional regulator [Kouleothrix sp.]
MFKTIIKTKINLPAFRRSVVWRPRLLASISEGITQGHQLTLISAPAGFGKTTVIREWITAGDIPVAWISLDEGDGDPIRFLTYLVAALQTLIAGVGDSTLAALQSSQPVSISDVLTSLLNELASTEDDFVLVLDDYHTVASTSVDALLALIAEHMPPPMHLVITTREDPALPLARLRARNQLTEIRTADLRFTENEAAEFFRQVMGLHLSAEEVAALDKRTEGWVAGLQLAALSMQGKADTSAFIHSFSGANPFVLEYLLVEVLHKQPESVQRFLLPTSILNRLNASLCDALLQHEHTAAQDMLETLDRANLFVIPLDDERSWYRYHHLFRDLLRQRLSRIYSKEELAELHTRASAWFEQNGEVSEAFQHAMSASDFERAARLLESHWLSMDENFQTGMWLGWVKQLPLSIRRVRPVLLTQMGWSYMDAGNAEASESSLKEAEASLKNPLETLTIIETEQFRTLPARIAIARAYNAQVQNRFDDTVKYVEIAQDLVPHDDEFMQAQATAILSGTYWASGELDRAFGFMSHWVDAAHGAGNVVFAIAASFGKADICISQGRLRDALQVYQTALHWAELHNAEQHTAHHHLGLGLLHHEMGDDERAAQHVQKAFELGKHATIIDWAYRKSLAQAQLKESEGDYDVALNLFDEAARVYVRTPIPNLRPVAAIKARLYLKQKRFDKAHSWASKSGLSLHDQPDYLHEFERLTLAKIALADAPNAQQILTILKLLDAQLKLAQQQNRLRSQIEILTLQALALHTQGETSQAASALEQALNLAAPEGYWRIFVNEGEGIRLLIDTVHLTIGRAGHPLSGYLARLSQPTHPHEQTSNIVHRKPEMIEPLSERELEVLRLIAQGLSNQEITQTLVVALSTVKGHNLRIFAKLQAKSRTEAVARARVLGLL